jgi:hypothetical protein
VQRKQRLQALSGVAQKLTLDKALMVRFPPFPLVVVVGRLFLFFM